MNQNELVLRVRKELGNRSEARNRLNGALTSTATSVVFEFALGGITANSTFEIGREVFYVWSIDPTLKTATVQRGHLGSTAVAHTTGSLATVSPDYPTNDILTLAESELRLLPQNGVYRQQSATITFDTVDYDYNLSLTDILHPYMLEYKLSGYDYYEYGFIYDGPAAILRPHFPHTYPDDLTATLHYKAVFGDLAANLTEGIEVSTGLPATAHELLVYGVTARLLSSKEIERIDINSNPVSGIEEVPPQATMRGVDFLRAQYDLLLQNEMRRLNAEWPYRRV